MEGPLWIPVCHGCGKVIGALQESYHDLLHEGVPRPDALTQLGIRRPCCRVNCFDPPTSPGFTGNRFELVKDLTFASTTTPKLTPAGLLSTSRGATSAAAASSVSTREVKDGDIIRNIKIGDVEVPVGIRSRIFEAR